ncbi:MAG: PASTA domain-containing protein, partial [bacterium]|nr:PASTA domain-containing protein [bacterium]
KKKTKKKKKTPQQKKADRIATLLALLTVLLIIIAAILVYFGINHAVSVPQVKELTVEEATEKIESAGLEVDSSVEYSLSDDIEKGKVITQSPDAGKRIKRGTEVSLVVSIGKSNGDIEVPDVTKLTFDDAISKLSEKNLNYTVVEGYSDEVQAGRVIRQTPLKGTKVKENDVVTLHISSGRLSQAPTAAPEGARVEVPSLNGETKESAAAILQEAGLIIGSTTMQYSETMENFIIDQSPEKGKMVEKGSVVNIVISRGPGEGMITGSEDEAETSSEDENEDNTDTETKPSSSNSQSFSVKIPDAAGDTVNVEIVANGRTIHNAMHKKSEGSVTVDIEDTDDEGTVKVQAYIDGSKVSDKTLEFN